MPDIAHVRICEQILEIIEENCKKVLTKLRILAIIYIETEKKDMETEKNIYKKGEKTMKNPAEFFKLYDDYCFFKNPKNGYPLLTQEEYYEMNAWDEECRAEQEAENAWLRHAENQVDDGFERWEWSRLYS